MAYSNENLSVLAYSNSFTLWHYKSEDLNTAIVANSYFDESADMLRVGDMILVNADIDGTPKNGLVVVTANSSGVVETKALVTFA
ncbi:MAG: hypothetical protein OIF36_00925 [Alphaproteobacteria bacterium]|jgi:hypothetical protein|nr:hypothetical protein [Alphaproteobacteria bacterium]MCV6599033.1 hypothetical protein [Alphaproteobacteria bacterium]